MRRKLLWQAITKFLQGAAAVGTLIFLPAGTLHCARGWLLMGILFVPMFAAGIVMLIKNPALLQSRLNAREKAKEQSLVVKLSSLMFIAGFVCAGLDYRFQWLSLPAWASAAAAIVFLLSYPLVLGSLIAFYIFLLYIPIIMKRILHEEKFLAESLGGYAAYMQKVKYRLLPLIW